MKHILYLVFLMTAGISVHAQVPYKVAMPYPQQQLSLSIEGKQVMMAYMDVKPAKPNGKTAMLLHGKNFNGFYWRQVIEWLSNKGYRVIVPDQIGFGNSSYPDIHYSFHRLAYNTRLLLDTLGVDKVTLIGHSMGGMLSTRFTLMYPERVERLVLEDPIGLEDYRTFVPYRTLEQALKGEQGATYESYLAYQKGYYPEWKPQYDTLVSIQAGALTASNKQSIFLANALTFLMIYEQPVVYEFPNLKVPVLLMVGEADRTVVGKALVPKAVANQYGQYQELGKKIAAIIPGAKLVSLPGIGHIPHIQDFSAFTKGIEPFIDSK